MKRTIENIATYHFTYDCGLAITSINNDSVSVRFFHGETMCKPHSYPIEYKEWEYSDDLEPCFIRKGETFFLSDFVMK